jgi:hypothetical protein
MDDDPDKQVSAGFLGLDSSTDPTKLSPAMLSDGYNAWCRGDGYVETRPGLKLNSNIPAHYLVPFNWPYYTNSDINARRIRMLGYFDQPGEEYLVAAHNSFIWTVGNSGNNVTPTPRVTGQFFAQVVIPKIVQLVGKLFVLDSAGVMMAITPASGGWTVAPITTFSDSSAMPAWTRLAVHGFRVLAYDAASNKMYASAIGSAGTAADWVKTENIRVGEGDGDPAMELVGGQGGFVTMLNEGSVYQIDTSQASLANWSSVRVTKALGCVEGKTAVAIGQDVYFLSRYGVVNLGSLNDTISISQSATLSAPIQKYIDRINWANIANAFATTWGELYLLALPLDSDTFPKHVLPFHLRTRQWQPPWHYPLPNNNNIAAGVGVSSLTYDGLCTACVVNFSGKKETIFGDTCGRLLRIDDTVQSDEGNAGSSSLYTSWAQLRRLDHGNNQQQKQPFWADFVFQDSTAVDITMALNRDGTAPATDAAGFLDGRMIGQAFTGAGGLQKKRHLTRGKPPYLEAALQVFAQSGKLKLREATHAAFLDAEYRT